MVQMMKRKDGSTSPRGLYDNLRSKAALKVVLIAT